MNPYHLLCIVVGMNSLAACPVQSEEADNASISNEDVATDLYSNNELPLRVIFDSKKPNTLRFHQNIYTTKPMTDFDCTTLCPFKRYECLDTRRRLENNLVSKLGDEMTDTLNVMAAFGLSMDVVRIMSKALEKFPTLVNINIVVPLESKEFCFWRHTVNQDLVALESLFKDEERSAFEAHNREINDYLSVLQGLHPGLKVNITGVLMWAESYAVTPNYTIIALEASSVEEQQIAGRLYMLGLLESINPSTPFVYSDATVAHHKIDCTTSEVMKAVVSRKAFIGRRITKSELI